jgi:hypothetical protein
MSFRIVVAVATATALLGSSLALAARPAKDSHFAWCTSKNNCPLVFDTNKKGKKLVNFSLYTKCSAVPPMEGWPNIKVNRKGKFSKEGSFKNVIGETISFEVKGKFVKKKKARGTFDVDSASCSDGEHGFVAKRKGAAA